MAENHKYNNKSLENAGIDIDNIDMIQNLDQ